MDDKTFAWTVEGRVRAGALSEYAKDRQHAETSGLTISDELWDGTATQMVKIVAEPVGPDRVQRYEVYCAGRFASYSVDARS